MYQLSDLLLSIDISFLKDYLTLLLTLSMKKKIERTLNFSFKRLILRLYDAYTIAML